MLGLATEKDPAERSVVLLVSVMPDEERPLSVLVEPIIPLLVIEGPVLSETAALAEGDTLDTALERLEDGLTDGTVKLAVTGRDIVPDAVLPVLKSVVRTELLMLRVDMRELPDAVIDAGRLLSTLSNPRLAEVMLKGAGSYPSIRLYNWHDPTEYVKPTHIGR